MSRPLPPPAWPAPVILEEDDDGSEYYPPPAIAPTFGRPHQPDGDHHPLSCAATSDDTSSKRPKRISRESTWRERTGSTSPGPTTLPSSRDEIADSPPAAGSRAGRAGPPLEYEYSGPLIIRNTFIETVFERSPSLEGFYRERRVKSCPGSLSPSRRPKGATALPSPSKGLLATAAAAAAEGRAAAGQGEVSRASVPGPSSLTPSVPATSAIVTVAPVELPSVGSAGHGIRCKPCAFVHTKGCANGVDCQFCHICEPGEQKRRHKERMENLKKRWEKRQNWDSSRWPSRAEGGPPGRWQGSGESSAKSESSGRRWETMRW
mmetsp:Transcript_52003/g.111287  ORF Transcript_52003/g.111287 Transcript_52003/m.111287 type:complete len:320 (-) Transcript_52003:196-1155(-)